MATNEFGIVCPEDCDSTDFGAIEVINPNCPPKPKQSEITDIFLMHPTEGIGPADWNLAPDWAAVIDNADATNTKVKQLSVIGSKPAPDRPEILLPRFKLIKGDATYTIEASIPSLPDLTYDFLRKFQCGSTQIKFWYRDAGGFMYGRQEAIESSNVEVEFIHETGKDSYTAATMTITWEAVTDPQRIVSPV